MKKQGTVVRWDDQRGFGFIRCNATSQDIFFHVRDCEGGTQPPLNATVDFEEIHVGGKGPRAMAVRPVWQHAPLPAARTTAQRAPISPKAPRTTKRRVLARDAPASPLVGSLGLSLVWVALLVWGVLQHRLPAIALVAAFGINATTFFAYWVDKNAAHNGQWRTKEDTLHLFGLAGGWPAARLAQRVLRHKTIKPSFHTTYWATVWVHLGVLCGYLFWDWFKLLVN